MRIVDLPAPNFNLEAVSGDGETFTRVSLDDFKGKWLVIFFYPLDFTFVCPTEITGISDRVKEFTALNAAVVGVSVDSIHSHKAWIKASKDQGGLGKIDFPLASDFTKEVARKYGVLVEEAGVALRGLFIIDPEGKLKYQVVHDLNVGRSVSETLRVLQALQSGGLCPIDWAPGQPHLKG